jgi:hypothetical protein
MFDLQTRMTGAAQRSFVNQKSAAGMSSPGGEDTGEGELNCNIGRKPVLSRSAFAPSFLRTLALKAQNYEKTHVKSHNLLSIN